MCAFEISVTDVINFVLQYTIVITHKMCSLAIVHTKVVNCSSARTKVDSYHGSFKSQLL